ncbi:MAG: site-2 protease family protein [Eubacteriales bacterium]|nr:site-2 protease family protein [Eubacteriales bacterium]
MMGSLFITYRKGETSLSILNRLQAWFNWLTTDPLGFLLYLLYFAVSVLLTLILHEIAHGYVAYRCGDPTAKMLGRLSMDPRKHLDPIGTACLVFLGFGWAKPVPVNPRNFGNYRRDDFLVSIAGVTVNLTLFLLSMALAVGFNGLLWKPEVIAANGGAKEFLSTSGIGYSILVSGSGGDFTEYMLHPWVMYIQRFLLMFYSMNLGVGLFNLLPIPPLDGFHIFNDLLFKGKFQLNQQVFQIAQVVLLVACFSGVLNGVITAVFDAVEGGVLNLFLLMVGKA